MSIRDYEYITPNELNLSIEAYVERVRRENEDNLSLSWLTAYYQRVKKMPNLKNEIKKADKSKQKKQSVQEMYANFMSAFGGRKGDLDSGSRQEFDDPGRL